MYIASAMNWFMPAPPLSQYFFHIYRLHISLVILLRVCPVHFWSCILSFFIVLGTNRVCASLFCRVFVVVIVDSWRLCCCWHLCYNLCNVNILFVSLIKILFHASSTNCIILILLLLLVAIELLWVVLVLLFVIGCWYNNDNNWVHLKSYPDPIDIMCIVLILYYYDYDVGTIIVTIYYEL